MANDLTESGKRQRTYSLPAISHEARSIIEFCLSGSTCDASTDFKIALINMPTQDERGRLMARHRDLMKSLHEHDRKEIGAIIAEMLASYDVAKQKYKTAKDRMQAVAKYVQELHGVPTWAVSIACQHIRMGTAPDISHTFEPTTIQVRVLAISIAEPYKTEVRTIGNILTAKQYQEPVDEEQRKRVGELMRGLADEMRLRKEKERDDRIQQDAPRAKAVTDGYIRRDYKAHGDEPRYAKDGVLISRSLIASLRAT